MKAPYPLTPKPGTRITPAVWHWLEYDRRRRKYRLDDKFLRPDRIAARVLEMETGAILFVPNFFEHIGALIPHLIPHGTFTAAGEMIRSLRFHRDRRGGIIHLADASLYFPFPQPELILQLNQALFDELKVRLAPTPGNTAMRVMRRFIGMEAIWQNGDEVRAEARGAFTGGAVHWRQGQYPRAYQYDIKSAYPWSMSQTPYPLHPRLRHGLPAGSPDGYILIGIFDYETDRTFSPLVVYGEDEEAYHPTEAREVKLALNHLDLQTLLASGDLRIKKVIASIGWRNGPPVLAESMSQLSAMREKYQDIQMAVKIISNACYGKIAERDEMSVITLVPYSAALHGKEITNTIESDDILYALIREDSYKPAPQHNPIFAGLITAAIRQRVYAAMDPGTVYVDTDGFISTHAASLDLGSEMGSWKLEAVGPAVVLGPRIYGISNKTKIAGQHEEVSRKDMEAALVQEVKVYETIHPNPLLLEKVRTSTRTLKAIKYPHVRAEGDRLYITRSPTIRIRAEVPDYM